jgi:hypothetical protein
MKITRRLAAGAQGLMKRQSSNKSLRVGNWDLQAEARLQIVGWIYSLLRGYNASVPENAGSHNTHNASKHFYWKRIGLWDS